jgi:IS4 transposase
MGDRVYASPPGVSHVVNAGGDVIVRLNRGALPLYERNGKRLELLPRLRQLKGKTPREYTAWVKNTNGDWIRGRLIALRQSVEATRWALKRMQRRAQQNRLTITDQAREFAEYFMVWTTVPKTVTASQILDLYRLRWQIELVFKRMKSILGLGHLPKTDPRSAQAWLQGKVFVGLLIERMLYTAKLISPWGYSLAATPQSMARD